MPFYEYVCEQCGFEIDLLVPVGTEIPECPECRKRAGEADPVLMKKKVSKDSGFKLNGGGWAKDGYG